MKSWHGFIKLVTVSTYKLRQKVNYKVSNQWVMVSLTKNLAFQFCSKIKCPKNQTKHYQIPMIRDVASKGLTVAVQ